MESTASDTILSLANPSGGLNNRSITVASATALVDRLPVGDWRSLEVELSLAEATFGGSDCKFVAIWESFDPARGTYVMQRRLAWHLRVPEAASAVSFHDRVPHLGDYLTIQVFSQLDCRLGTVSFKHTNREPTALPPTYEAVQSGGLPNLMASDQGLLLVLVARNVANGVTETWNLPPYHGPFTLYANAPGGTFVSVRSRTYDNLDAAGSGAYLYQAAGALLAPVGLWMPPRINVLELNNGSGAAQNFYVTLTAAQGPFS